KVWLPHEERGKEKASEGTAQQANLLHVRAYFMREDNVSYLKVKGKSKFLTKRNPLIPNVGNHPTYQKKWVKIFL
ncbi:MAG: hypothetical protein AAFR59_16485, partial [Bacteroidota bacterium]